MLAHAEAMLRSVLSARGAGLFQRRREGAQGAGRRPRRPHGECEAPIGVYGTKPDGRTTYHYRNNGNYKGRSLIRAAKGIEEARAAMAIDWMRWDEIREAIPPAYTEFIGRQLLAALSAPPARGQ